MKSFATRILTSAIALCAAMALYGASAKAQEAAAINPCNEIRTEAGKVTGVFNQKKGVCTYKGIPYAQPPIGELRFAPPQKHKPWADTFKAEKFGEVCMQTQLNLMSASAGKVVGGEDCLSLNIWQPVMQAQKPLPVMVYIHGGGFTLGSGGEEFYEGTNISSTSGVILVTLNYRLSVFGFFTHTSLKDAQGHAGNYGMLDQVEALRWVRDNIASFGGDPENITLFGESAGGMSVSMHILSPLSNKYFKKAIIQSGPLLVLNRKIEDEYKVGQIMAASLGCTDPATAASCLRAIDGKKLFDTISIVRPGSLASMEKGKGFAFAPAVDGYFMPDTPLKLLKERKFPSDMKIILGTNKDEGSIFVKDHDFANNWNMKTTFRDDVDKLVQMFGLDMYSEKMADKYPESAYASPRFAYQELVADMMFYCPNRLFANLAAANNDDVYVYYFNMLPISEKAMKKLAGMDNVKKMLNDLGVFHGAELPFIFNTFKLMGFDLSSPETAAVSKEVMGLWTSFAKTGTPAAEGVPAWPKFNAATNPYLYIGAEMKTGENFKNDSCVIVDELLNSEFAK